MERSSPDSISRFTLSKALIYSPAISNDRNAIFDLKETIEKLDFYPQGNAENIY